MAMGGHTQQDHPCDVSWYPGLDRRTLGILALSASCLELSVPWVLQGEGPEVQASRDAALG